MQGLTVPGPDICDVRDAGVAGPASPNIITDMGRHYTSHKVQGLPTSVSAPAFAVASPLISSHEEWFDDGNGADLSPPAEATPTPTAAAAADALRDANVTLRRRRRVDEEGEDDVASSLSHKRKVFLTHIWLLSIVNLGLYCCCCASGHPPSIVCVYIQMLSGCECCRLVLLHQRCSWKALYVF